MKTELRASPHFTIPNATVFEVWHNGVLIATVTGADGPGVRVITKYPIHSEYLAGFPNVVEVEIEL